MLFDSLLKYTGRLYPDNLLFETVSLSDNFTVFFQMVSRYLYTERKHRRETKTRAVILLTWRRRLFGAIFSCWSYFSLRFQLKIVVLHEIKRKKCQFFVIYRFYFTCEH